MASDYHDDEISLIDLMIALKRRKWLIAGVTIACLIAGLAFWSTQSRQECYVTSIEIGRYLNENNETERIEAREAVEIRLRNAILPSLRNELIDNTEKTLNGLPKVNIRVPEEEDTGDFVFLKSITNPNDKEIVGSLHQGILDRLSEHHERRFNIYKQQFSFLTDVIKIL